MKNTRHLKDCFRLFFTTSFKLFYKTLLQIVSTLFHHTIIVDHTLIQNETIGLSLRGGALRSSENSLRATNQFFTAKRATMSLQIVSTTSLQIVSAILHFFLHARPAANKSIDLHLQVYRGSRMRAPSEAANRAKTAQVVSIMGYCN